MIDYYWINDLEAMIVMERIRGVNLEILEQNLLSKLPNTKEGRRWKIDIVNKVLVQLISALNSLEKNGIYHWDIHPGNILIDLSHDENFNKDELNKPKDQIDLSQLTA